MKKQIIILAQVLAALSIMAQSPEKMSYQAILRDSDNNLLTNTQVGMRTSILQGSPTGSEVYKEIYNPNPTTNENGLINLEIGGGVAVVGTFSVIEWEAGPYFIKTETDPNGGTNYTITGVSQLLSVPYALYAKSVESCTEVDPVFTAHPAFGITSVSIIEWDSAYDWGDHADEGYLMNEEQVLSISGDTIFLTGGSFVVIPATNWLLDGNTGTTSGNNFIGTTDNQALDFRTNNVVRTRISTKGQIETLNTGGSVFVGEGAGNADDLSNNNNVFTGYQAGYSNTTGEFNTVSGYQSLYSNTIGDTNLAIGNYALQSNVAGNRATAIGHNAMRYANNAATSFINYNVAVGFEALRGSYDAWTNTGNFNTAAGYQAMSNNTTGLKNASMGYRSLVSNTTGNNNTAVGCGSMELNFTGNNNCAFGVNALRSNNNGYQNSAFGLDALSYSTSGQYNTAIGYAALSQLTAGNNNTGLGYYTQVNNQSNATAMGYYTYVDASNKARIGNASVTSIGGQVAWSVYSDERIKNDIQQDVPGLDFIKLLKPVTYHYDIHLQNKLQDTEESGSWEGKYDIENIKFSGFLAQEVEAAAKSIGYEFSGVDFSGVENGGLYSLRYSEFVVPLVQAVQEQQVIIDNQQMQIDMLIQKINEMENRR